LHATSWSEEGHQARPPVRAHQGQRQGEGRVHRPCGGDRCPDGQQGARAVGRSPHGLAIFDARHFLGPSRWPPVGHDPSKGQTKEQLYNQAKRMNVKGRSRMNKRQLLAAVNRKK
jgi:hypothetical protein